MLISIVFFLKKKLKKKTENKKQGIRKAEKEGFQGSKFQRKFVSIFLPLLRLLILVNAFYSCVNNL